MKVKVTGNVQLLHGGQRFAQGDVTEVPDDIVKSWIWPHWAVEVKATPPRKKSGR